MTVQELIDRLRLLPPDHLVLVEGYENGWDSLASVESSLASRQMPCAEWDGEFELATTSNDDAVGSVLLIGRRGHRRTQRFKSV